MIAYLLIAIAALILQLWDFAVRPSSARCPRDWYAMGVRPSGRTTCVPEPPLGCGEPTGGPRCAEDPREIPREIYCTGGAQPIVVDERTVSCQWRH